MPEQKIFFDESKAAAYDKQNERLGIVKDGLHFAMRAGLSELADNAHILCVGAGTGAEIAFLAAQFPQWHFTAVDPSKPMLDICRAKAREQGFADRCRYHEGFIETLEMGQPFDAATSILASHFIMHQNDRRHYFRDIAARLVPGGILFNADLSSAASDEGYAVLLENWGRMMQAGGVEFDPAPFGRDVAVLPPTEVEAMIGSAGFDAPVQCYQMLLVRAWIARLPHSK